MIQPQIVIDWLIQSAVATLSSMVFGVLFQVPRRQLIFTGITGGSAWLSFLVFRSMNLGTGTASFLAAIVLTWVSRILSFARREPVTTFLICGIFPIVPGTGIYNTGYQLFMGDTAAASSIGIQTLKTAALIALGVGIVLSLPPIFFSFKRQRDARTPGGTSK